MVNDSVPRAALTEEQLAIYEDAKDKLDRWKENYRGILDVFYHENL